MLARQVRVLAGNPQVAAERGTDLVDRLGNREAAMANRQVNRRVKVRIGELLDHVRTNDPDLRSAVGDERGHIKRTHADHPHVRPFTGKG